ncbi:hypothetical protein HU200_015874 [Digitaria exilis]|uniref:Uncharacterized protein n=1 Tax=Digitaria exilis TaxID=1010633 RepID=A0A835F903_9POAL|nr:hypothetical protein HU200_015874 [Digitaria exilis]
MGTSSPSPHLSSASVGASLLPPALRTPPLAGMRSSARSVASSGVPICFGSGLQLKRLGLLETSSTWNMEACYLPSLPSEASLEAASSDAAIVDGTYKLMPNVEKKVPEGAAVAESETRVEQEGKPGA